MKEKTSPMKGLGNLGTLLGKESVTLEPPVSLPLTLPQDDQEKHETQPKGRSELREQYLHSKRWKERARIFVDTLEVRVMMQGKTIEQSHSLSELHADTLVHHTSTEKGRTKRVFIDPEEYQSTLDATDLPRTMRAWMILEIRDANRTLEKVWLTASQTLKAEDKEKETRASDLRRIFEEKQQIIEEKLRGADYETLQKLGRHIDRTTSIRNFFKKSEIDKLYRDFPRLGKRISDYHQEINQALTQLWQVLNEEKEEPWGQTTVQEIGKVVGDKKAAAAQVRGVDPGRYTKDQFARLMDFLQKSQEAAELALQEKRYPRLRHILSEVREAWFREEVSEEARVVPPLSHSGPEKNPESGSSEHPEGQPEFVVGQEILDQEQGGSRYRVEAIEGDRVSCVLIAGDQNYAGTLSFDRSDPKNKGRFEPGHVAEEQEPAPLTPSDVQWESKENEGKHFRELFPLCKKDGGAILEILVSTTNRLVEKIAEEIPEKLQEAEKRAMVTVYLEGAMSIFGEGSRDTALQELVSMVMRRIENNVLQS